jgi:hypothetical protein
MDTGKLPWPIPVIVVMRDREVGVEAPAARWSIITIPVVPRASFLEIWVPAEAEEGPEVAVVSAVDQVRAAAALLGSLFTILNLIQVLPRLSTIVFVEDLEEKAEPGEPGVMVAWEAKGEMVVIRSILLGVPGVEDMAAEVEMEAPGEEEVAAVVEFRLGLRPMVKPMINQSRIIFSKPRGQCKPVGMVEWEVHLRPEELISG